MSPLLASVFVFLAGVTGAVALFRRSRDQRAEERLRTLRDATNEEEPGAALRRGHSAIPTLRRWLDSRAWADELSLELQRADVNLRVGEYVLLRLLLAGLLAVMALIVLGGSIPGVLFAIAGGLLGYLAPRLYVSRARQRRAAKIEGQLVELVPSLASSLRAGFAFQQAVEVAADQLAQPLQGELQLLISDVNLGASMDAALLDMSRRVGSADLDMIVTAIMVQRTTGGNLSEVLDRTAETMRERERIRGELMTLTAQQRLTGFILSIYPVAIGLLLLALMPSMWSKLFTEPVGQGLLAAALALQALGFLFIRRALRVDF